MDLTTAAGLFFLALFVGTYGSIIGAGGGFLLVAGLALIFDLDGVSAVGTSVVTILSVQATGAWTYDRQGLVDRPTAKWFVMGSIPVAFAAASVADEIPQRAFDLIIGVLLLALAAFVILVPTSNDQGERIADPKRPQLIGVGSFAGILTGAFGVGAGLVTVPVISRLQRLSAHRAAATTTLIGAASGVAASVGHALADNPRWGYLPFLLVGAVIGARIGATNAGKLSSRTVLVLLASGLLAAGLPLVVRAL